jgi:ribosomal protein S18 acetylase RimI-like enzyme
MQPELRIATSDDLTLLVDFMRQFYAIDNYPFDAPIARKVMQQIVEDGSVGRVWLIDYAGATIGYVVLTFGFSLEYRGRDAYIDELFLLETYRGQGLGSYILQFVLDACPALGIHALHLEVEHANVAGQRLYRKHGFAGKHRHLLTRMIDIP